MDFSSAVVVGVPLILVVIGLVEVMKKLGLQGSWLIVASLLVGLSFGVAYQWSLGPLVTFAEWFGAIVYGLGIGLVATGIYAAAKSAISQ